MERETTGMSFRGEWTISSSSSVEGSGQGICNIIFALSQLQLKVFMLEMISTPGKVKRSTPPAGDRHQGFQGLAVSPKVSRSVHTGRGVMIL